MILIRGVFLYKESLLERCSYIKNLLESNGIKFNYYSLIEAGQDFMSSEAALQFTRGLSSNFTFNVTLLEDEIVEGPENFSVVLSVGDDKRNLVSFNRQSALVRIMDNDGKSN